jgi:hypothetical protein
MTNLNEFVASQEEFSEAEIECLGTATTEVLVQESTNNYARLDETERGHFFSGDAYAILFTYTDKVDKKQKCLIYFWLGRDSSLYAHPRFALGIYKMLETNLKAMQNVITRKVVVFQHKEPAHFLSLFNNKIVIQKVGRDFHLSFLHLETFSNSSTLTQGHRNKKDEVAEQATLFHIQTNPKLLNSYFAFQTTRVGSLFLLQLYSLFLSFSLSLLLLSSFSRSSFLPECQRFEHSRHLRSQRKREHCHLAWQVVRSLSGSSCHPGCDQVDRSM